MKRTRWFPAATSLRPQRSDSECGLACLRALAQILGVKVPKRASLVNATGYTPAEGTTEEGICRGVEELGFEARVLITDQAARAEYGVLNHKEYAFLCVEEWNHWVLFLPLPGNMVSLYDPWLGEVVVLSKKQALQYWRASDGTYTAVVAK